MTQFEFELAWGALLIARDWQKHRAQQGTSLPKASMPSTLSTLLNKASPEVMLSDASISSQDDITSASDCAQDDTSCVDKPSTSTGSEHSEQFAERSLYCLALVNSETGDAVRVVTDEEAEEVARALAAAGNRTKAQGNATSASATPTSRQNSVARPKPGGPCDNCGVLDSPQWRRGPTEAPVLCNACGTRFRRTSQLASGGLRALKRAAEAQKQQQPIKHPKVSTLVACTV